MIKWAPFKLDSVEYDLSHLHPHQVEYIQPSANGKPEKKYTVDVCYSLHCFTKQKDPAAPQPELDYGDTREIRTFNLKRYKLSKQLPGLIQNLNAKKCMHTGKGNYLVIEVIDPAGKPENYEVYFEVSRPKSMSLRIFVQSAYVRDENHTSSTPRTKKISLFVLLHNTSCCKPIKIPQ